MRVTNALLPLLNARAAADADGYGRILYTSAPAGLVVTGSSTGSGTAAGGAQQYDWAYTASKKPLVSYTNTLRQGLLLEGSRVLTTAVYPMTTRTGLADDPIWLQDPPAAPTAASSGPDAAALQAFVAERRAALRAGLDPDFVASAFVQLLRMKKPPGNAAVGARSGPLAAAGGNDAFYRRLVADTQQSPYRFGCFAHGQSAVPLDASASIARLGVGLQAALWQAG